MDPRILKRVALFVAVGLIGMAVYLGLAHLSLQTFWPGWLQTIAKSDHIQAWTGVFATVLAIIGAVWAGYLHQEHKARQDLSERLTAAYHLARKAGDSVIYPERWMRAAAVDPGDKSKDQVELGRYPNRWAPWIAERQTIYLDYLGRLDIVAVDDPHFYNYIATVRSRLAWFRREVGPHVGKGSLGAVEQALLADAAYQMMKSLRYIRAAANHARARVGVEPLDAAPLPASVEPPASPGETFASWDYYRSGA